ncbi:unnamed protein product [Vicia faba]|uniref:Uncharacterized protein n=1 Tax=Vicia faba TaxID=3906 RepID=A0AAV0ZRW7_VICFA|nr:unnamed protein product [Vicia faba]
MRVNKGKKGPQPGAKKKKSNREQKADAETHVKLNSDEKMSRDDVNISSQLKQPILPSSGEPLLDVPEIIKWMFFNGCSSKQGIEQSSTLKQAKNQKTTMTTVDTAILKHGQRKQQSLIPGSPTQVGGSAQIQHSTLKQAKNQKTTMTTTDTAERSILQHGKRKQQPFTAGSSIQVAGPAQIQHKKQDYRPEIKKSRDVYISPQLKLPMLPSSGEPLVDVPDSIKSNAELYRGKLRSSKTLKRSMQCFPKQGMEQSSTLEQAKNQKTMRTTVDTAGRSILKPDQRKQQSLTTESSIPVAGSAQIQHSTLKQAKTQKTMKTTIGTAGRSIPNHGQRKQQSFTAGSSIQVEGSAQSRPEIKKSRDVYISPQLKLPMLPSSGEPLVDVPDSIKSNAELYRGKLRSSKTLKRSMQCFPKQGMEQSSTLEQAKNQKTMRTTVDTAGRSILKPDQRKQQSLTTESSIPVAGSAQIQHSTLKQAKTQKTMKTTIGTAGRSIPNHGQRKQQSFTAGSSIQVEGSAQSRPEIKKSRDVYISPQLKLPMLPSSGEPLVDVPDSIKSNAELYRGKLRSSKTLKRSMQCFPKQGMEQSSTLEQAKNQKTMRTTVDTAGRSILKPDQRKQQSLTTESSIPVAGSAQIQHSTLKQAKTQKTMKTTIGTAGRSIPNHGQRKQQSFTAGSSIQVEGSAQSRPEDHSLFGGLSNRSSAQFQKDHIDHGPFKKQKTARMCPSMSLDDYFEVYKPRLEVEGDINYENNDSDVEGDINYGNDDGEKTNNNPMEGEA